MLKSVSVTNFKNETLEVELAHPEPSGLIIYNIEGIGGGKADINTTDSATGDGSWYNSAKSQPRNIVLYAKLMQTPSVEENRHKMYQYFPLKTKIRLLFKTDQRSLYIDGYVESNDTPIFSSEEYSQISIVCPDPCFYSISNPYTIFSGTVPLFEFPFWDDSVPDPSLPPVEWPKFNDNMIINFDFSNPNISSGLHEFTSTGLTIDDWLLDNPSSGNGKVTADHENVTIYQYSTNSSRIRWYNTFGKLLPNNTYTASYLDGEGVHTLTFSVDRDDLNALFEKEFDPSKDGVHFKIVSESGKDTYSFEVSVDAKPAETKIVTLKAVKVEAGYDQTLAELKDGKWVLMKDPGPAPDFYPGTIIFGDLAFANETNIDYHGTTNVGISIEITFIKSTKDITIYNVSQNKYLTVIGDRIAAITGKEVQDGDTIKICTVKGNKSITLSRPDGSETNIIGAISRSSTWLELNSGSNIFKVTGSDEKFYASIVFRYNEAYMGL